MVGGGDDTSSNVLVSGAAMIQAAMVVADYYLLNAAVTSRSRLRCQALLLQVSKQGSFCIPRTKSGWQVPGFGLEAAPGNSTRFCYRLHRL